ncbi:MAG TPA: tRNA (adenosine(37)-N6)-threonylcarbamoyltransferase complex transferase subunit TsaD [Bacteroidetes bacterium]|nr:tRNA (adenosine(37)-N6)-threonylcarbamoyltransferase complex transferase subunit TsaD [Bacteroidota bacterium]
MDVTILGIESSCDDTSAAVIKNGHLLSNIMAGQEVHEKYGGVVPELASRAHQQHIVPVVDTALREAEVKIQDLNAVAFTVGPGLLGSLLVGSSFAKGLALALNIQLIAVNHLMGHVHALFLPEEEEKKPSLPFLCLLVSGGHTQLMKVNAPLSMDVLGKTIDDAAGEAFDKCAKMMNLPYPGGPVIDELAAEGDPEKFSFAMPKVNGLDYSFSGLKTSFLYFLRDRLKEDPDFIPKNIHDLAASLQNTIIKILMEKLIRTVELTGIKEVAIAGGVSANSQLKKTLLETGEKRGWKIYFPVQRFTTDNAAMITMTAYFKYLAGEFDTQDVIPKARMML